MRDPRNPTAVVVPPGTDIPPQSTSTPTGWEPYAVAALRALLTALLVAATTFLATWSHTDDAKTLAIATASAFVSILVTRFGIEGTLDQARKDRS